MKLGDVRMNDEPDPQRNGAPPPNGGDTPPATPKRDPAEHLAPHRFQKGKSGNPAGRPKGRSVTAVLRSLVEQQHNGKAIVELLAERILKEALSGKFTFAKEVIDRLDGKVPDKALVETKGEQKIFFCPAPRVMGEKVVKRIEPPLPEDDQAEG